MRRYIMIIGLVVIQVSIVLFFTWQFQKVTTNGVEFRLLTKPDAQDMYTYDITNYYYANFDVNYIKEEQLKSEVTWNDVIYVQLSKENDHYAVKSAHRKKPKKNKDEIILQGRYKYEDKATKTHYIEYGMEEIPNIDTYGQFKNIDALEVTFLYSDKWNQFKVLDVEEVK